MGPPPVLEQHAARSVLLLQGNGKASDIAKELKRRLKGGEVDEFLAALPSGVRLEK